VRLMTFWDTQQALHESENSLSSDEVLSRVLAFVQGFPVMHEEEVVLLDFSSAAAAAST
jgi:hypothetical protein